MTLTEEPENEEESIKSTFEEPAKNEQSQHITRGIGSLTIQNLATSALGFVFLAVLLRLLPGVDYGIYSALSISVGIAAVVAPMGLQYAAAKFLAESENGNELRSRAKKIVTLSVLTSLVATVIFTLLAVDLSVYFTKSITWSGAFLVGGIWLFFSSLGSVVQGTVQGLKRYTSLAGMLFVARLVMVVLTIAGLEFTHNLFVSFYAWIIYFGMLIFWSVRILFSELSRNSNYQGESSAYHLSYRNLLKYSLPLGIAGVFFVLATNIDLVVVGGDLSPTSLGIYNTAVTISNVLNFVLITPLVTALLPEASFRIRNPSEISNGMRLAIRFVVLLVLPASFLVAALSSQLLELFSGSSNYQSGAEPLQIIGMSYVFFALQFVIYSLLQAKGNTIQVFLIAAITAGSIYGLSLILVPELGLVGASIARSISVVVGMAVAWYVARSFLKNLDSTGFYIRSFFSAMMPFLILMVLTDFVSSRAWTLIPYTIVGISVFLVCLHFLKVLNQEDKAFLLAILPSSVRRKLR